MCLLCCHGYVSRDSLSVCQKLEQVLLPFSQKVVARAGELRTNLAMAQDALASKRRVVCADKMSSGLDLCRGRRSVFIIARERDADAAGVDLPVAGVPADRAVLQQAFTGAIGPNQPVISDEDHAALAKVSRPDWLAAYLAVQDVVLQVLKTILAQHADRI